VSGTTSTTVQLLAKAIAAAEGFGIAGAIPTLANNPGDITDTGYPGDTGQTLGGGIRVFDTVQDGWNALYDKIENWFSGNSTVYPASATLAQVGATYSNGDPNWATNVAAALDVDPSVTLAELAGGSS